MPAAKGGSTLYKRTVNGASSTKGKKGAGTIKAVKSGIGLSTMSSVGPASSAVLPGEVVRGEAASFITSRTARVLLAGAGFLADAYDLFVINLVLRLLREEYPHYALAGSLHKYEGFVASAALWGSIIGQLVAGSLADVIGRKKIFVATAALITIGSLGSSICRDYPHLSVYVGVACWRFLLGVGVGGEYPLAATVTSESSSASRRGSIMAAVFAMQGVGALLSVFVVLLLLSLGFSNGATWRAALAFGAVPAMLAFPWRLRMHETETFERVKQERKDFAATAAGDVQGGYGAVLADADDSNAFLATSKSRWSEIVYAYKYYKWHMLGTALCWFLLDVDFYANGIFNHDVTSLILSRGKATTAREDAWNSLLLCSIGVPGYWLSVMYLERVGRKAVQFNGFVVMAVLFFICAYGHDWFLSEEGIANGRQWIFLLIYSLTFLFSNFGPNTTSFVIPGEIYPPEVRATCHGLSAASGKLGAATGAFFFPLILGPGGAVHPTPAGLRSCMMICALVAATGALATYLFTPSYSGTDLESDDNYLALDHSCLVPTEEDLTLLMKERGARANPYNMYEVIEHDYSMTGMDAYLDADGGLVTGDSAVAAPAGAAGRHQRFDSLESMSEVGMSLDNNV